MTSDERRAIEEAIPHRDPFLFLDRVFERAEDSVTAAWRVPPDAPWFRGHYPGEPVLPGVLICEHVFQAAAVLISGLLEGFDDADGTPVLTRVEDARFRRVVRPGEELLTRVALEERLGPAYWLSGRTEVEGRTVLRTRFVLSATGALARAAGEGP